MRNARATLLGIGIAFVFVVMLRLIGEQIWPYMTQVDTNNEAAVRAAIASAPLTSMLWIVGTFAVGGFIGSFLACKMSGGLEARPSWIVGVTLLVACLANDAVVQQPLWMHITSALLPLPVAWLGFQAARVR